MDRDPLDRKARQLGGPGIGHERLTDCDPELVLGCPGGDLGVSAGYNIRIDAEANRRGTTHAAATADNISASSIDSS